ncbi:PpiC-type peptidyl-prolyl cis-trans isomerase [Candidatus Magnetoovum chiemensis]|nr:PpiC-type peptidyl-prolyl cis-trans isomerase [Candidatus Magnetoovum chiemensis]
MRIRLILVILVILLSCQKKVQEKPYIIKIDSVKLSEDQLEKKLSDLYPDYNIADNSFKNIINEIINNEMLALEAKKEGIEKEPDFIKKMEEYKKELLKQRLIEKNIKQSSSVSEKEAKHYYDTHPELFKTPDRIRARHILVESAKEAYNILRKLKNGVDFAELANLYSCDEVTSKQGGDLGFFERGRMKPEFDKAAFNLKTGEVSQPVKTVFGYHIIEVKDIEIGEMTDFDLIKNILIERLSKEKKETLTNEYTEKLRKNYNIEINDKLLDEYAAKKKETITEPQEEVIPEHFFEAPTDTEPPDYNEENNDASLKQ